MSTEEVVVVTGGAGFFGSNLVRLLQEKSPAKQIRVLDLNPYVPLHADKTSTEVVDFQGDVCNTKDVAKALAGATTVYHTAALIDVSSFPDYAKLEEINVKGTANVVSECIKQNVGRLVFTSTIDAVVDRSFKDLAGIDETVPIPKWFNYKGYGSSKQRAEQLVLAANGTILANNSTTLKTSVIRPTTMYGENDNILIPRMLSAAQRGRVQPLGKGRCQNCYVGNIAWGHILLMNKLKENPRLGGEIFFITDDTPITHMVLFSEPFLKEKGYHVKKKPIPVLPVLFFIAVAQFFFMIMRLFINTKGFETTSVGTMFFLSKEIHVKRSKAEQMLGYKPIYTYNEAVERSNVYYRGLTVTK